MIGISRKWKSLFKTLAGGKKRLIGADTVIRSLSSPLPPDNEHIETDVLIVGSGPVGCTFARKLFKDGRKIMMIDAGAQLSKTPGMNMKNSFLYQRNVNEFTGVIESHLHKLCVATNKNPVPTLDPGAFNESKFVSNNQNPVQEANFNLPEASATYAVGGMSTHWTACTPRQHKTERSEMIDDASWNNLYDDAETLIKTSKKLFDDTTDHGDGINKYFIRNNLVKDVLNLAYKNAGVKVEYLPLAGERRKEAPEFITWSASDTVLGETILKKLNKNENFQLREMMQCERLEYSADGEDEKIDFVIVKDLLNKKTKIIKPKIVIIAAGAVLTPQILVNSGIDNDKLPALGHYLCEQPLAFCQIVLLEEVMDRIDQKEEWRDMITNFRENHPYDPIHIPYNDPDPQCYIPVTDNRPWHCQIHRDAFSYGGIPPNVDTRLIVDLRWFGRMTPSSSNYVKFSTKIKDTFGMPQPIFHVKLGDKDRKEAHQMMEDMVFAAGKLGGFLPGSEPSFQQPGLALHITGTCRMGKKKEDSVVDVDSKVWGYNNLYLGSCGVIPTGAACNPTLTAMAIAIKASANIEIQLSKPKP